MTSDAPTTVVWIAPAPPDAAQAGALASWARQRGVTLTEPAAGTPTGLPTDDGVVGAVETLLAMAREALVAREGPAADRALDTADAKLRAHAELPQAAWLMAEVERARSARWRRVDPVDLDAAERAAERADALDGGRLPGVGEQASSRAAPLANLTIRVPPGDRAWIDGAPADGGATPDAAPRRAGLHAVRVAWRDRTVWATWVDVPAGDTTIVADAPGTSPCSIADVSSADLSSSAPAAALSAAPATAGEAGRTVEASRVLCPTWVAAAPGGSPGVVAVAVCTMGACGPMLDWHTPVLASFTGLVLRGPPIARTEEPDHSVRWPAWATWTLAGTGAAIAAGIVLVAAGAFKGSPGQTAFVSGGLKTQ